MEADAPPFDGRLDVHWRPRKAEETNHHPGIDSDAMLQCTPFLLPTALSSTLRRIRRRQDELRAQDIDHPSNATATSFAAVLPVRFLVVVFDLPSTPGHPSSSR